MNNSDMSKIEYLAKKYDETNIPLYLSYPVDSFWKSTIDTDTFIRNCGNIEEPYLYFHFPYCKTLCYYCCCSRIGTADESKKDEYIEYVGREMDLKLNLLGTGRKINVSQMHWGGGTPTYMSCGQIERFYDIISRRVNIVNDADSSISIEAYPDEEFITVEKLKLLRGLGFNEISFGIQDFDERVQRAINRNCKKELVKKQVEVSKEAGFDIHVDLCYGLPFQGLGELERTLEQVVDISPKRIAFNPYAHFPMIFPMQKKIPSLSVPNSFIKTLLAQMADDILTSNGYFKVGYDTFVRSDDLLYKEAQKGNIYRDFMATSIEKRKDVFGFGNSAISRFGNLYFYNSIAIDKYSKAIESNCIPLEAGKGHIMTRDDLIRDWVINKSILCDFEIDKSEINTRFSMDFDSYFEAEKQSLLQFKQDGLVEETEGDKIRITRLGRLFARHTGYIFDAYYNAKKP